MTQKIGEIYSGITRNDVHYFERTTIIIYGEKAIMKQSCDCFDGIHEGVSPVVSKAQGLAWVKSYNLVKGMSDSDMSSKGINILAERLK